MVIPPGVVMPHLPLHQSNPDNDFAHACTHTKLRKRQHLTRRKTAAEVLVVSRTDKEAVVKLDQVTKLVVIPGRCNRQQRAD